MSPVATVKKARLRHGRTARAWDLYTGRWLVLAPHPDDETLGVGALICALAEAGRPVQVVYLTDGAGSHPGSASCPPGRLSARRRREARAALRRLAGHRVPAPIFLDWSDAKPHPPGSPAFLRAARRLAGLMQRLRITKLTTTWPHEPHCDHAAAAQLATAAAARTRGRVKIYWYVVWGWRAPQADLLARAAALPLPNRPHQVARRRAALAQHRSQLGSVITDSPDGFRLPSAMTRAVADPQMLFAARGT